MTRDDADAAGVDDRADERRRLLLHVAASSPHSALELSARLMRSRQAVQEDLDALMTEGRVHLHEGNLHAAAGARIIAEAPDAQLRELFDQVLAELESGTSARPATLVALAEAGCHDAALLRLLVRAAGDRQEDAGLLAALSLVVRARGESESEVALLRAADAAGRGRADAVLALTEPLFGSASEAVRARAAILAAGAHMQGNRLEQASALFEHAGRGRAGTDAVWAVVAAIGRGDVEEARRWRAAMGAASLTSRDAGFADLADGLLLSVEGAGDGALDALARSVSTLAPLGAGVVMFETPAALAALIAIGRGEPATAELLLERALRAEMGGESGRRRHLLLISWALMVQGRMDAAEARLRDLGSRQALCDRDLLLHWCLIAGIARRRTDSAGMRDAWREIRALTFGLQMTLYDLLPLGEMMVVAARLRDADRMRQMTTSAVAAMERLDSPIAWSASVSWHGVQAAFQAEDPAALIPHANALVRAERISPYAATLAQAGQIWLSVLRREADFDSVEASVRALAAVGHVWDAARLAGQAALQHPERETALSMMQLARSISNEHERETTREVKSSALTAREQEVARLVLDGQGYRAIGARLFISPKTVEHHVARIRSRLGASSRGELLERLHDILAGGDRRA
ncbi:hypothetical protein GCM10009846_10110 [Agrococcus versicolor]|uniref:HTH luxR-type domain-containing protein n=1 Tax=Agrococcus versicolor TaxID=501482 RepID=A0ABP5MH75_9MICO